MKIFECQNNESYWNQVCLFWFGHPLCRETYLLEFGSWWEHRKLKVRIGWKLESVCTNISNFWSGSGWTVIWCSWYCCTVFVSLLNVLDVGKPFGVNIHKLNRTVFIISEIHIMSFIFQKCALLHPGSVSSPLNLIRMKFLHMRIGNCGESWFTPLDKSLNVGWCFATISISMGRLCILSFDLATGHEKLWFSLFRSEYIELAGHQAQEGVHI